MGVFASDFKIRDISKRKRIFTSAQNTLKEFQFPNLEADGGFVVLVRGRVPVWAEL